MGAEAGGIPAAGARPGESGGDRGGGGGDRVGRSSDHCYGPLYAKAVLRPFAEQLVLAVAPRAGDTICDIRCDAGELEQRLRAAEPRITLHTAGVVAPALALQPGSCDIVVSLFALGFSPALLHEARRVLRAAGTMALITWRADDPPAHEVVLRDVLRAVTGAASPFLEQLLTQPNAENTVLRDVVRFDGFTQYWAAMVEQRPLREELQQLPESVLADARHRCRQALAPFEMRDGTLRIPVRAALIQR